MKEIKILGIDLAKNIFQLHGVDAAGNPVLRKAVSRRKLMEALVNLPPLCLGTSPCGLVPFG